ncbi:hypothetical protein [Nocardioides ochotonae]|uniref:hypothetical protein n=1 Tax=Nocardioides ochotonae TaxID=2685869 RepID=UPI001407A509|nr:hypothetical protein [Nocardioides ochotonae]
MPLPSNPYVRMFIGGLVAAIAVATPIVDDGVTMSEALSILAAFLSGTGLTAVPAANRQAVCEALELDEADLVDDELADADLGG